MKLDCFQCLTLKAICSINAYLCLLRTVYVESLCAKLQAYFSNFLYSNIDVTGSSEQNPNSITFGPNFENQNDDEKHETAQKDTSSRFFRWNAIFGLSFGNPFSNNFVDQQIEDSIDDTLVSDFSSSNTTLESESDQDASYEENRLLEGFDLYDEIPAEVLNSVDEQSDDDQSEKTITIIAEKEDLPGDLAFEIISQEEIAIAGGNQELDETIGNGVNRLKTYLNKEFEGLLNQDAEKDMLTAVNMPRVMVTIAKLEELHGRRCKELQEGVPCGSDVIYSSEFGKASVLVLSWSCKNNHRGIWRSSEVLKFVKNNNIYVNDIMIPAAVALTGNNYSKFSLLCQALKGIEAYIKHSLKLDSREPAQCSHM
ncbi:uncharacterized protein LOC135687646 [Rhopilema esculentum]|uniref:uncharacterized protein LOC135687646 n=1 Tax=Rhopilema esculentum TaxID=499914 RepID=UPI0031E30D05